MSRLCIVTALPAETRSLLDALKLRQHKSRHLRLYGSTDYLLLEAGTGKLNAAASVGAVLQAHPDIHMVVNFGIAGGTFGYAEVLAAHHVKDQASGIQWFPHLPDNKLFRDIPTASINTLDAPDTQYRNGILFDMEAAGVFSAACRYLSTSQVHSIKVISDNPDHDIRHISKDSVISLVEQRLPTVLPMFKALHELNLTKNLEQRARIDAFVLDTIKGTHHSASDEQILKQLVQQHVAVSGDLPCIDTQIKTSRNIRKTLTTQLAAQPFVYRED